MWDFLKAVLEHGGTTAVLFVLTVIGMGIALRLIWKQNQALMVRIAEMEGAAAKIRINATQDYVADLKALQVDYARRLDEHAKREREIQEKRVLETREMVEKVVKHIQHIDTTVDKLGRAVDVLIDLSRGR